MITYIVKNRKNPKTGVAKYYANIAPTTPWKQADVIEEIEKNCTLTSSDIKACLDALQFVVQKALLAGCSVRMGDLGSFRPTLSSTASDTAEQVTADNVKRVHCRFTCSGSLYKKLQTAQFQSYVAAKEDA